MTLGFEVFGQRLTLRTPYFAAADSVNYLRARFSFSSDWDGMTKTAVFYKHTGDSAYNAALDEDGCCAVPWEVIAHPYFYVSVYAGTADEETGEVTLLITTEKVKVKCEGSGYALGDTTLPPSADVYTQLTTILDRLEAAEGATSGDVDALDARVGELSDLTTAAKNTIVAAINELDGDIGDLSQLTTTAKGSLVAAANELKDRITAESNARADGMTAVYSTINTNVNNLGAAINSLGTFASKTASDLGEITALTTNVRSSAVAAINEVWTKAGLNTAAIAAANARIDALPDNNTTYTMTLSGRTITLTPSTGAAQSVTLPDANTTYTIEYASSILTLIGSDGSTQSVTIQGGGGGSSGDNGGGAVSDLSDYWGGSYYRFDKALNVPFYVSVDEIRDTGSITVSSTNFLRAADDYGYDLSQTITAGDGEYTGFYRFTITKQTVSGAEPENGMITVKPLTVATSFLDVHGNDAILETDNGAFIFFAGDTDISGLATQSSVNALAARMTEAEGDISSLQNTVGTVNSALEALLTTGV